MYENFYFLLYVYTHYKSSLFFTKTAYINLFPIYNLETYFQGVTALHIAVRDRNLPMVEYLLTHPYIDPGDAHLHAIRDGEIRITQVILNKLNQLSPGLEYAGVTQSADFPDETTPLTVAAQYGQFEMINFLRNRLHMLPKPHPPSCNCETCKYGLFLLTSI